MNLPGKARIFLDAQKYLAAPPTTDPLQWADAERYLSPEASALRGKYQSHRAPYQREPLQMANRPDVSGLCLKWASQLGKSEILLNLVGYFIRTEPAPILLVQPTEDLAESWSKERLTPMLRDTPTLAGLVADARSRDSQNTIRHKVFPGGNIAIVGANAPAGLAGRPRRVILQDEIDRYPPSAGSEGDPCALADRRAETFFNAVLVKTSTPTRRGASRIDAEFDASDQRQWFCPCPVCHAFQVLQWSQVRWPKDHPELATYKCAHCDADLDDAQRVAMVRAGQWRPTHPERTARGYHLNGIASLFRARRGFKNRLHQMAADFLRAKAGGVLTLRVWVNTFLAESFIEDAERVDAGELAARCEEYDAEVPAGVLLLTGAVDVQGDRLVCEIVGWGLNEESWGIEYRTLPGRPDDARTWQKLESHLERRFARADGSTLAPVAVGIDAGNFADYVLKWTRRRFARGTLAVKGSNQPLAPIVSAVRRNNRYKAALLTVGTDQAKGLLYSRLKLTAPDEPGRMHFPGAARGYDAQFFSELTAEELRITFRRGFAHREWHKTRARNEALDVRVYGLAMLRWLNPDWPRLAGRQHQPERPAEPGKENETPALDLIRGTATKPGQPPARPKPAPRKFARPPARNFTRGWARY